MHTYVSVGFRALHVGILGAIFGYIAWKTTFQLSLVGDFLGWHLPAALQHVGKTTFISYSQDIIAGHPPLPHYLQGLLVLLTGMITATQYVALFYLGCTLVCLKAVYKTEFSVAWYLTALLAIPLVSLHLPSGLLDLPAALALLTGFAGLHALASGKPPLPAASIAIAGLASAMLTKGTTWPIVVCVLPWAAVLIVRNTRAKRRYVLLAMLFIGVAAFPIRNLATFGNPTYPYSTPIIGELLQLPGRRARKNNRIDAMLKRPPPLKFVHSLFEVSRFTHPQSPYSWSGTHMNNGGMTSPHYHVGGIFVGTVLWTLGWLYLIVKRKGIARQGASMLAAVTLVFSLMPVSGELRYSLFIPIGAVFLVMIGQHALTARESHVCKAGFALLAAYVLLHLHASFWRVDRRTIPELAPEQARVFWKEQEELSERVLVTKDKKILEHLSIFWSGPTFNEYPVRAK